MRIAYFLVAFPVISETFILNQISGMIDRGHEIDIYAKDRRITSTIHAEVDEYMLHKRTYYIKKNYSNKIIRMLVFIKLVFLCIFRNKSHLLLKLFDAKDEISKKTKLPLVKFLFLTLHILAKEPYDVIHCQFGTLGPMALLLRNIGVLNGKLVTSFRGSDISKHELYNTNFYSNLFIECDLFLPVSKAIKQRLIDLGCNEHKIHILHSGIDIKKFNIRERPYLAERPVRIISIARLVEKKGLIYAIQAVSKVNMSNKKVIYKIIGEGELSKQLENMIYELNATSYIQLLGWKNHDEIIHLLNEADLMLAPSVTAENGDQEGIPNAPKEAMAMGMPIVSTFHGGIPELVEDGVSGFLVPERDVEALSDRMMYLYDRPELWSKMGRAGRNHIEAEFDINKLNDQLEKLYLA